MIKLEKWKVGYGKLGLDGYLGYFALDVNVPGVDGFTPISAHAPSEGIIISEGPIELFAAQNIGPDSLLPVECFVDGQPIGLIKISGEKTKIIKRGPGAHKLQTMVDRNRYSRTVWFYRECIDEMDNVSAKV